MSNKLVEFVLLPPPTPTRLVLIPSQTESGHIFDVFIPPKIVISFHPPPPPAYTSNVHIVMAISNMALLGRCPGFTRMPKALEGVSVYKLHMSASHAHGDGDGLTTCRGKDMHIHARGGRATCWGIPDSPCPSPCAESSSSNFIEPCFEEAFSVDSWGPLSTPICGTWDQPIWAPTEIFLGLGFFR